MLLPGSRQQEIDQHWDVFVKTVDLLKKEYPTLQIIVGKSDNVKIPTTNCDYKIEKNAKKAIIVADVAIVASGTATLECAIEKTPMVVCYKFNFISWLIAKCVVKVKYSSIVNLIANKEVVPELLQSDMKPEKIRKKISNLISLNSKYRHKMINDLKKVRSKLGSPGVYNRIAEEIIKKTKN